MIKKQKLTEAQSRTLIREVIVIDELYSAGLLTEAGLWQKIKYQLGKLGSMEKGGKILGRGAASDEAEDELQALMNKAENATLKGFMDRLQKGHPEYPNQESQEDFVNALQEIGIFFASLHAATKKKEGEKGYLPCEVANRIIEDLKKVVQKTLDYDLSDVYKHLTEEEQEQLDELFGRPSREDRWKAIAAGEDDPWEKKAKTQKTQPQQAAAASPRLSGKDSSTIAGLKSNMLPALLALGGSLGTLASVLTKMPWFTQLLTKSGGNPAAITKTLKGVLDVKAGEGPTQMLGRILQGNAGHYSPSTPLSTLLGDMKAAGVASTDLAKLGANPKSWLSTWQGLTTAPGASGQTLAQVFGATPQKGLLWHPTLKGAGVPFSTAITKAVAKGGGAAAAKAAGTAAAASWAAGVLGIGLLASAAAVKAIRIKGLKSSRAQALNDLMNTLNPVDCDTTEKPPVTQPPVTQEPPEKPYEFPLLQIEKMIEDFLEEQGIEVDESDIEDLSGKIQSWFQRNRERGADVFDMDNAQDFAIVAEEKGKGDYKGVDPGKVDHSPRRRYKTKNPNLAIKKSAGRSRRSLSLSTYLHRLFSIGNEQGRPEIFASARTKDLRKLKKKIVKYVYDYMSKQGPHVQHQQEAQDLTESKTYSRWKVLSGIK